MFDRSRALLFTFICLRPSILKHQTERFEHLIVCGYTRRLKEYAEDVYIAIGTFKILLDVLRITENGSTMRSFNTFIMD